MSSRHNNYRGGRGHNSTNSNYTSKIISIPKWSTFLVRNSLASLKQKYSGATIFIADDGECKIGRHSRLDDIARDIYKICDNERSKQSKELHHFYDDKSNYEQIQIPNVDEEVDLIQGHEPQLVASYSWTKGKKSVINIPGILRRYVEPQVPFSLERVGVQSNLEIRSTMNLNKSLHEFPEEPIFATVRETRGEDFPIQKFNFVTDRNNLKKLFNLIMGIDYKRIRLDFERFKNVIVIGRFDLGESDEEILASQPGHHFEDECCKGDETQSFRAILDFEKEGLRFLMRCEVDAMEGSNMNSNNNNTASLDKKIDEITKQTATLSTSDKEEFESGLIIQKHNNPSFPTDTSQFIELKTKKQLKFEFMRTDWFQAFIAGTQRIVVGIKQEGQIVDIIDLNTQEIETKLNNRTNNNQVIRKIVALLKRVQGGLKDGEKASLVWEPFDNNDEGSFRFYRNLSRESCLPSNLRGWVISQE